jgi:hypothetical protein
MQVMQGTGWQPGLRGEIRDNGRTIAWPDGTFWRR